MQTHTELEREVIVLKAVTDLIDDMVNYEMFVKFTRRDDMNLTFNTRTHMRLFTVLLVDLLSKPRPDDFQLPKFSQDATGSASTFLHYLRSIYQKPLLTSVSTPLREPVEAFATWLDAECCEDNVWLPSLDLKTSIRVPRIVFIKICGDIAKHSFPRMGLTARRIRDVLTKNGHPITLEQAYLVMPDFYGWFHSDVIAYHSSAIGEFLNNIRWGIYEYLKPEFERSYTKPDGTSPHYTFKIPPDCSSELGREMYWGLMNWARSVPMMPRFEVTRFLKMRH